MARITITIPKELVLALDEKLARGAESRSAVMRRLVEEAIRQAQEQEQIAKYIEGYRKHPQTEEELGWADEVAEEVLREESWP